MGDEVLQPVPRRLVWAALSATARRSSFLEGARLGIPTGLAASTAAPIVALSRDSTGRATKLCAATWTRCRRLLERVDALLREGVIGGDGPNAADYQIATSVRLLMALDDLRPLIEGRPAARHALAVAPDYPGRMPPVFPPALAADRAAAPGLTPRRAHARCERSLSFRQVGRVRSDSTIMEAATPIRQSRVGVVGGRLVIYELQLDDECAVRLVHERERAGDDPAKAVREAVEIGARVLDREQAGANAEYVKTEFQRASRELGGSSPTRRVSSPALRREGGRGLRPGNGQLAKGSRSCSATAARRRCESRPRARREALVRSREDLVRQFSAADGSNPLADFKAGTIRALKQADERQHQTQQALLERIGELERRIHELREERERLDAVDAERERGTAKGRAFEESVAAALDACALTQGDVAEAVGDLKGAGEDGRRGRGDRRVCGPRARPDGLRGQGSQAFDPQGARRARSRPRRPRRRLRGASRAHGKRDTGPPAAAARVQRRQAGGRSRPGRANGRRARAGLPAGARPGPDGAVGQRCGGGRRGARRRRARAARDGGRAQGKELTGAEGGIDNAYRLVEEMAARVRASPGRDRRARPGRRGGPSADPPAADEDEHPPSAAGEYPSSAVDDQLAL